MLSATARRRLLRHGRRGVRPQNALTSLPEAIGAMEALRELNVRQNGLGSLPGSLGMLPALEGLFVQVV